MREREGFCAAMVRGTMGWRSYPCSRKGVVEEDGNVWCKQHAPSNVKARRTAADKKFNRKWAVQKAGWAVQTAKNKVAEIAIAYLEQSATHDELEAVVAEYHARVGEKSRLEVE